MLVYEICRQDIFHVSGVEQVLSILFKAELTLASSIASGTYSMPITFFSLAGNEVGYRSGTGIKVVNHFITG